MRCQARRGRRRGSVLSQAQIPGPLQRSPSGRGAGNEGDEVGCPLHRIPRSEGRASEAHRQGAHAVANIQAAGRIKRRGWWTIANDRKTSPGRGSRSDWCTIRREPPGPPARLTRHLTVMPKPDPRPVILWDEGPEDRRRLARETHAAGNRRRTGRRKEPHTHT